MFRRNPLPCIAAAFLLTCATLGCNKKDVSSTAGAQPAAGGGNATPAAAGESVSPMEKEARDAALAEAHKHWAKGADGWATALNGGTDFAPILFVRQLKDLSIDRVEEYPLADADRLNGMEWAGEVWLAKVPAREAGEPSVAFEGMVGGIMRQRGRWTQWVEYQPMPLKVQKAKGQWQVQKDNTAVAGHPAAAADFAKAGVK